MLARQSGMRVERYSQIAKIITPGAAVLSRSVLEHDRVRVAYQRARRCPSVSAAGANTGQSEVAVNDDPRTNDVKAYLHVMPRYPDAQRWNVFQIVDDPPGIALAASVSCYDEAKQRAARGKRSLRFAEEAWRQMVAAGAAPPKLPAEVTIV